MIKTDKSLRPLTVAVFLREKAAPKEVARLFHGGYVSNIQAALREYAWRDYTELEAEYPLPMVLQVVEPPRRYVISSVRSMEIQLPVASSYTLFHA